MLFVHKILVLIGLLFITTAISGFQLKDFPVKNSDNDARWFNNNIHYSRLPAIEDLQTQQFSNLNENRITKEILERRYSLPKEPIVGVTLRRPTGKEILSLENVMYRNLY